MDSSYKILIVDDIAENIQVAMSILKDDGYSLSFALSGEEALDIVEEQTFDLILLDIMMPNMNGFEVCEHIKSIDGYTDTPVLFLTAKTDMPSISNAFFVGGVDYIAKPFRSQELLVRVKTHLELHRSKELLKRHNISLQTEVEKEKNKFLTEVERGQKEIVRILTEMIESSSANMATHVKHISKSAYLLAHYHPAVSDEEANILFHVAPMHSVGEIGIDSSIMHADDEPKEDEFDILKSYTTQSYKSLINSKSKIINAVDIVSMQSAERWDGAGYPVGLKGEEIHIFGRIIAMSNVIDALLSGRPHVEGSVVSNAVSFIKENRGKSFDPQLVDIFLDNLDAFISIIDS